MTVSLTVRIHTDSSSYHTDLLQYRPVHTICQSEGCIGMYTNAITWCCQSLSLTHSCLTPVITWCCQSQSPVITWCCQSQSPVITWCCQSQSPVITWCCQSQSLTHCRPTRDTSGAAGCSCCRRCCPSMHRWW